MDADEVIFPIHILFLLRHAYALLRWNREAVEPLEVSQLGSCYHCNFHNVVACTQCLDALQGDERPRSTILALHYYHRELDDASILLYGYVAGLVLDT